MARLHRLAGSGVIALAAGLALADASIVTLGLPSILVELDASVEGVALVLGVYTAVLAVGVPVASVVVGRAGARRVGAVGMTLFGLASLACGLTSSLGLLLALRALQAIGGAAALVAAFELLGGGLPGAGRRLWVAASVFGTAAGPALGGILTEVFDWRAIFIAQAPLILPGAIACLRAAPVAASPQPDPSLTAGRPAPVPVAAPSMAMLTVVLALVAASLTAVIFLVVLLLIAGWSVEPLVAALAVSVLPLAALAASRAPGDPTVRAGAGALLIAGGIGCLALLPSASAWWTVAPQLLAGAGMGLALPALAGELLPERVRGEAARLISIRHLGIALALAVLAPIVSAQLDSTIASAREQGAAAMLDSRLDPRAKINLAPALFASLGTDDPRGQLERAVTDARAGLGGEQDELVAALGQRLDLVVTGAVRDAFRVAFIISAALALLAAVILLWRAFGIGAGAPRRAVTGAIAAALVAAGAYAIAFNGSERERVVIADPCANRELPDSGGVGGLLQGQLLVALDRTACEFSSSREELLLALFDDELRARFERDHGVDPRSVIDIGPAILGL